MKIKNVYCKTCEQDLNLVCRKEVYYYFYCPNCNYDIEINLE